MNADEFAEWLGISLTQPQRELLDSVTRLTSFCVEVEEILDSLRAIGVEPNQSLWVPGTIPVPEAD